jgi:hypothetical protein
MISFSERRKIVFSRVKRGVQRSPELTKNRSSVGNLVFSSFFKSSEISFSAGHWRSSLFMAALGAEMRWMLYGEDVGPEVVDVPFLSTSLI